MFTPLAILITVCLALVFGLVGFLFGRTDSDWFITFGVTLHCLNFTIGLLFVVTEGAPQTVLPFCVLIGGLVGFGLGGKSRKSKES